MPEEVDVKAELQKAILNKDAYKAMTLVKQAAERGLISPAQAAELQNLLLKASWNTGGEEWHKLQAIIATRL